MAMAMVLSRAQRGMDAPLVRVEVDLSNGLPSFTIVGLAEAVVKESKDRVRAAIANSGFSLPSGRITVNLAPADLPKEGGRFDLPIACAILLALGQLPTSSLEECELFGELSLNGGLQPVKGVLPAALAASQAGHTVVLPQGNAAEAMLVSGCRYLIATRLLDVVAHARGANRLALNIGTAPSSASHDTLDLSDVRGQVQAKRALEVAAAGEHSLLMIGPPGTGKSMLAQRLPGLLPPMTEREALEAAAIRSIAGIKLNLTQWRIRPFRSPHHTASAVALVGGSSVPRPGEISLAHHGVLFLDELPEFDRHVLEVLREPLETASITISRAARQEEFPASFQLVAAMNPCPCGYLGDPQGKCRCTAEQVQRYRARLSGPLLDRLDLHVEVPRIPAPLLQASSEGNETSATVAERVLRARELQNERQGVTNARLGNKAVERFCQTSFEAGRLLDRASATLGLSARAYHRILKVARTIADLAGSARIEATHVSEAIALRTLDRKT
jgi:magnesium chelatase family protein